MVAWRNGGLNQVLMHTYAVCGKSLPAKPKTANLLFSFKHLLSLWLWRLRHWGLLVPSVSGSCLPEAIPPAKRQNLVAASAWDDPRAKVLHATCEVLFLSEFVGNPRSYPVVTALTTNLGTGVNHQVLCRFFFFEYFNLPRSNLEAENHPFISTYLTTFRLKNYGFAAMFTFSVVRCAPRIWRLRSFSHSHGHSLGVEGKVYIIKNIRIHN